MLQSRLPRSYYAQSNQRVWLEYSRRYAEPDLEIVRSGKGPRQRSRGGAAVAEYPPAEPVVVSVETIEHGPFQESFVEIRRRTGKEVRLVTSLEVLSPSNKTVGNPGASSTSRSSTRSSAARCTWLRSTCSAEARTPRQSREVAPGKVGSFDYHVSVHRFDRPSDYFIYPIHLEQRLPAIKIPLLPGDPDVTLDLQLVFDQAYDAGPYSREVDYDGDAVVPPLRADQRKWAAARRKASR